MTESEPLNRLLPQRLGMVVRLQAQPGRRAGVLDALHRYADHLTDEPATEIFVISLDPDESDIVWLHEWFHGDAGVAAHRSAPAFAELMTDLAELLVNPPGVMRFEPLRMHLAAALLEAEATSEF